MKIFIKMRTSHGALFTLVMENWQNNCILIKTGVLISTIFQIPIGLLIESKIKTNAYWSRLEYSSPLSSKDSNSASSKNISDMRDDLKLYINSSPLFSKYSYCHKHLKIMETSNDQFARTWKLFEMSYNPFLIWLNLICKDFGQPACHLINPGGNCWICKINKSTLMNHLENGDHNQFLLILQAVRPPNQDSWVRSPGPKQISFGLSGLD